MANTILLLTMVTGLILFILFISIKETTLSKNGLWLIIVISFISIVFLFLYTGVDKIKSDFYRVIHNSSPKKAGEVYYILFRKSADSCVTFINFKDQVVPKIDCCIWLEFRLCPTELNRIIGLRKYQHFKYPKSDSTSFLQSFNDRPKWWTPQFLGGDTITKITIKFNQDNEQTLFFGEDSSHIFLCDQAL